MCERLKAVTPDVKKLKDSYNNWIQGRDAGRKVIKGLRKNASKA